MRIVSISLAAALVTAVTFASAFAAERWQRLPAAPAMPVSKVAGYAPVNGIEAGDPVLLIRGGLGHADLWANQVRDLMTDHMVIVADSRGHGRSSRNAEA